MRSTVKVYRIGRDGYIGSEVRVNASFQKIPRLVGRLGSGVPVFKSSL